MSELKLVCNICENLLRPFINLGLNEDPPNQWYSINQHAHSETLILFSQNFAWCVNLFFLHSVPNMSCHASSGSQSFSIMEQSKVTPLGRTFTNTLFIPSEVSNPVIQPTLPYMGKIPGGLKPDKAVFIQGAVPANAKLFEINFHTGQSYSDGIAFHFNPRITVKYVYMNSLRNGKWEKDETVYDKPFPKGTSFSLLITIKSEGYEVYVNGLRYWLFQHRMPLEQVLTLGIRGDVFISSCGFIDNWSKTSLFAEQSKITGLGSSFLKMLPIPTELVNPVIQPTIPYTGPISGGTQPGMALFVQGTVNPAANQFRIDFKSGQNTNDDVLFIFNPRIGQYVYMNNFVNGIWQKEQLVCHKPFTRGATFSILIVINTECFEVYVNGMRHCTFTHRVYLGKVTTLYICGDACIHYFGFTYNWSRSPFFKDQLKITDKVTSVTSPLSIPSEIANAVIQPRIPHIGPITGQMRPGMALYVRGAVLADDSQFAIGFQNGQNYNADVAFIFNPRYDQYLYLNTYRNSIWEKEELVCDRPFIRGESFTVLVVIKSEGYEVYVNGKSCCMFKHRIPLVQVTALGIWGAVSVHFYGFIENWSASSFFKDQSKLLVIPSELPNPIIQPKIPYIGAVCGGIKPGMALYVEGMVPANGNQFSINFQAGQNNSDDVPLTFNPRIGHYVYLNSCRNGVWEKEQLAAEKPFMRGTAFNVLIFISSKGYEMYVNGWRHCTFTHRIPFDRVTTLHIWGDVSINFCGFTDNWRRSYTFRDQPKLTDVGRSFTSLLPVPSEISHPVIQPVLPYVSTIKGGIKPDMAVLFQGVLPAHAQGFEINFKTGESDVDDIAFHFNPRIGQYVYLNSFRNESWEKEECVSDKPFVKGSAFQIFIIIKTECYEVYINGIRHCMFKHRFPLEKVSLVNICGDVSLPIFGFVDNWNTLNMSQSNTTVMGSLVSKHLSLPSAVSCPFIQPTLSYVSRIKGGIRPDMAVFFQGTIPINGKRFEINFKTGESDVDDIAFHFNPRIGQYVYLNSFRNGSWEKEDCVSDKPFTKGAGFYMFVVIKSDNYEVYVNGLWHCMFKHRIPLEKVSTLGICGDISKPIYGCIDNWSSSYLCLDQSRITGMGSTFSSLLANPSELSHLVIQPTPPYFAKIPGGLRPDMAVYFQGAVPAHAVSFEINLQTSWCPESDIAFQFNPRIGQFVYLNSSRNGCWEMEESASIKPFTKETSFNMFVVIKSEGYEVYVNGLFHCMFKHRLPLENVCTLSIYGDVSIPIYGFIDNWSNSSFITDQSKITSKGSQSLLPVPTEVSQSFIQPAIPYVGLITGGLKPDMALFFQGTIPAHANGFEINFKTGPCDGDDIAFHFNPRIDGYVYLNSFRNGSWDKTEPTPNIPFNKGTALNMFVVIKSEGYEVYVNGIIYCMFKHRIPLEKVSTLCIRGDVSLSICGLTDNWKTSSFCSGIGTSSATPFLKDVSYLISNPTLPYINRIPRVLKQDMAILFQGTVPVDAKSFEISLKTGLSDGGDIAFHFNPRIAQYVYLNSFRNGRWEKEETAPDKPFTKGAAFQILLVIKFEGYEVYVNDVRHCVFNHRIPLEKVSTLAICGDVSLPICGFIDDWKTSSFYSVIGASSPTPISEEILFSVSNPTLPYVVKIPGGIKQDVALFFQGTLQTDAKGFEINFKTGPSNGDDIAFQFNPRIGQYIYLNSFRNGRWEKEESAPDKPFIKGATFQMFIVTNFEGYEVYVNGLKHCMFKHRIPLEKVSTLGIRGDVSLSICGLTDNWKTSSFCSGIGTSSATPFLKDVSYLISNLTLPYINGIPRVLKQDMAILFQGTVPVDAKSFEISLKTGLSDGGDIAFHFNPRIGQYVYLNSFRNGRWEKEETAPDKPFTKGEAFQILLVIKFEGYEVYVNDVRHCVFNHRIPLEKVSTLAICGDVSLPNCGFIDDWKTSSFYSVIGASSPTPISKEISFSVSNPTLPYVGKIPGGIKQDVALLFQGTVPTDAKGFEINFKTGPSNGDDIAFQFSPRIGQYIYLNSFRNGRWEKEESAPDKPFIKGATFQMFIVTNFEGYEVCSMVICMHILHERITLKATFSFFLQVYVNGLKHCIFKHRIPLEKVSTLAIRGDVSQIICGFIDNWSSSSFFTELKKDTGMKSITSNVITLDVSQSISNPAIPYIGAIPPVKKQDLAVIFQGTILKNAERFDINFQTGQGAHDDIAFHFNPRIGRYTALNSFRNGSWDKEESVLDKPFTNGSTFQIIVVFQSDRYEVYVNGLSHCTFKHRIPLEKVSTIAVCGEVTIQLISFIEVSKAFSASNLFSASY
ncbi:uncharacterized protein LOC128606449 [Ictalurus furcatus]|uniref:uncharacterized protein LOC128606449 n=1 Tax=Ictalurus furcatus TaxID=66913 RepID=UPI002350E223|nr:uncharacterized protein LOC128606449 [Ictalurus furcatus]